MTNTLRHLHSLGVRSFLVMTSPPIELNPEAHLPGHGGYHDRHMTAADAIYINKLIRDAALELERELSDANVMLFDFEAFHRLYTSFPEAFGLTDTERYNMVIHGAKPDMGQMGFVWVATSHMKCAEAVLTNTGTRTTRGIRPRRPQGERGVGYIRLRLTWPESSRQR
jgi:phospholipase/lecithinase/hemolysin